MIYRNVKTGREVERPVRDEWLDASAGWELLPGDRVARDDNDPSHDGDQEEGSDGSD